MAVLPIQLPTGLRTFELAGGLPPEHVELDLVRAPDGPGVQHLRCHVRAED